MTFPAKTPNEKKALTYDFSTEAAVDTTISNPVVTVTEEAGVGTVNDLVISSTSVIGGTQMVSLMAAGGLDGAKYRIEVLVNASNGEVHRIDKVLPVKEKAATVD